MTIPQQMNAARMHSVGSEQVIERIDTPKPEAMDILVKVRATGLVPNLGNILANWTTWCPHLPLPPLPGIFGLDPAGEIVAVGSQVHDLKVGDRVYVNPGRSCGTCRHCRDGDPIACPHYTFQGYFGFSQTSLNLFRQYPVGGFAEYMVAPASSAVLLPDSMPYEHAARLGYLGTAYSGLRKAKVGPGDTVLINGVSGTLGIGGALFALALGAERILGTARNKDLLARVKAIAPNRIETFSMDDGSVSEWVLAQTGGAGVDKYLDCLGPGNPQVTGPVFMDSIKAVRRGGTIVDTGAVKDVQINLQYLMDKNITFIGSCWFTVRDGHEMCSLVKAGVVDLSVFKTESFPLDRINEAISGIEKRDGGFSNYVVTPH